jgi:hypothetical protein
MKYCNIYFYYDFLGYLVKLLTGGPLPSSDREFLQTMKNYFPCTYDLKVISKTRSSLANLADDYSVVRQGTGVYFEVKNFI